MLEHEDRILPFPVNSQSLRFPERKNAQQTPAEIVEMPQAPEEQVQLGVLARTNSPHERGQLLMMADIPTEHPLPRILGLNPEQVATASRGGFVMADQRVSETPWVDEGIDLANDPHPDTWAPWRHIGGGMFVRVNPNGSAEFQTADCTNWKAAVFCRDMVTVRLCDHTAQGLFPGARSFTEPGRRRRSVRNPDGTMSAADPIGSDYVAGPPKRKIGAAISSSKGVISVKPKALVECDVQAKMVKNLLLEEKQSVEYIVCSWYRYVFICCDNVVYGPYKMDFHTVIRWDCTTGKETKRWTYSNHGVSRLPEGHSKREADTEAELREAFKYHYGMSVISWCLE
ncbi:MAG: hypothetical protein FD180_2546 [Planctomycetota bacterium]|nr:MAG: hypothetical protein FD180_2546 [Planctomycetota bacterium]